MSSLNARLGEPTVLRRAALVQLVANIVIVITGGAVRLTGSGLGCPTFPRCTGSSYVTTPAMGVHGVIEFGNRTLTFVVEALALICLVLAILQRPAGREVRRRRWWAALVFAGIPAQALLGGLTVLTKLNPWLVAGHFLLSSAIIAAAFGLWVAAREPAGPRRPVVSATVRALVWLLVGSTAAVLAVGTVVTGSGPHAGDTHSRRTGLPPDSIAQLHTDLVMLLVGLSVAGYLALRATGAPARLVRIGAVLIGVEAGQAAIGFVQYFTHLPVGLVGLHVAGSCAVWVAVLALLAGTREVVPDDAAGPAEGTPTGLATAVRSPVAAGRAQNP